MKSVYAVATLFLAVSSLALPARAQQSAQPQPQASSAPAASSNPASAIDPEKEADIRKLLELTGTKALFNQTIGNIMSLMQKSLMQANPDDPRGQMFANLIAQQLRGDMAGQYEDLLKRLIPVYDKYYTKEDIENIIQFYGTPLGQKLLKVTPDISRESQTIGYQWGSKIGRDAVAKVLQTHPDLQVVGARAMGAN